MTLASKQDIVLSARESMKDYGRYVIVDRAIPDYRDGLKPVHRAILWSMHELGLDSKARYVKGAKVVGDTMANYHPHGDGSIDGALIRMSQPWVNLMTLTDVHGNNGSIDGSGSAAMRYYECRQSQSTELLMQGLTKNAVNLIDNFDGTRKIAEVLPAAVPQAMINGSQGIAFGMATNILPHNPLELLDACIEIVKNPNVTTAKLSKIVKGPDFATGGTIVDNSGHKDEMRMGKGKYVLRGTVNLHATAKEPYLEITEVPWGLDTTKLITSIANVLEKHAKALGILRIDDESASFDKISIKIVCRKGTPEKTLRQIENLLYKKSKLQTSFSANNVMIVDAKPRLMGIHDYLVKFVEFRKSTLRRTWQFELDKLKTREHIVQGLLKLVQLSDEVIKDARASESRKHFIDILQSKHQFSAEQSEVIANLPLYRLGKQDFEQLTNELAENEKTQAELTKRLTDEEYSNEQLIADFKESKNVLKDFKRRSQFGDVSADDVEELELKEEDLVESKAVKVIVKKDLQVFRMGAKAYENNIDKYENDDIADVIDATTTDYIVVSTKSGQSITRFVNDLEQGSLNDSYEQLNKQIPDLLASDELVGVSTNAQFDSHRTLVFTKSGAMKVLDTSKALQNVTNKRYVKKLGKLMKLKEGDEVVFSKQVSIDDLKAGTLVVTFFNTTLKTPKHVEKRIDLSKYAERSDSASSSGFTAMNTKNGAFVITNVELEVAKSGEDEGCTPDENVV